MTLTDKMADVRAIINERLNNVLPLPSGKEARVVEAMRYSAIGTGKALRPFLSITVGNMLGLPQETSIRIGLAIEVLHTYSLIHDDLPAMDNDTLRRGKPTNHVQFDEATAILAGDALQALAFEILADSKTHPNADIRSRLVLELARSAGFKGMVGGQMLDLIGETTILTLPEIEQMQALKTGALLWFSCIAPALAAQAKQEQLDALAQYAQAIGLLFQITDDILDVEGDKHMMGKTLGKDSEAHKSTFVSVLGLEKAKSLAQNLLSRGLMALESFGSEADTLRDVITFIMERER
jgi:farnesyl diphosphate synthase